MHKLYDLKEKLIRELEDYSQNGKYSKEDVELIKYMASAVDHICNICADAEEDEYSGAMGGSYADGTDNVPYNGGSYRYMGRSYARGRNNARRDSMGRYSGRGYSRAEGMVQELRDLMQDAPNDQVRHDLQRLVDKVESMA